MPKKKKYSSNAEKQRAYRLRKKQKMLDKSNARNALRNENRNTSVDENADTSDMTIDEFTIEDSHLTDQEIEKIYNLIPSVHVQERERDSTISYNEIIARIRNLDTFASKKITDKISSVKKENGNTKYIDRVLYDFYTCLKELKLL